MSNIDEMKLRRLDLTVLLVFLGLLRRRKAVAVAEDMGLTQSSISHALGRLRSVFGDDLFLRRPHGLEPTALAVEIEPAVRRAVEALGEALRGPGVFDPTAADRLVRIIAPDYELATLVAPLIERLPATAPRLRIAAQSLPRAAALATLAQGGADLALGFFPGREADFQVDRLYDETYLVVARRGHPLLSAPLTPKRFADARHVVVSQKADMRGVVDEVLERQGLARSVVASTPQFFPALAAVAGSDLVATLPRRLVERFGSAFGVEWRDPPFPLRSFAVAMVRHRRDARNPLHAWLAGELRRAAAPGPT
jgi:DNA-binding transcriptional LysR family regulator